MLQLSETILDESLFRGMGQLFRSISIKDVERLRTLTPRRKRMSDHPLIKDVNASQCKFGFQFESLGRLFALETGIATKSGPYGPFCDLRSQDQIRRAVEWQEARKNYIFLRDMLDCSIALDFNFVEAGGPYTETGQAEHDAKTGRSPLAVRALTQKCREAIIDIAYFKGADSICAVPPSPDKDWDLPTQIVARLVTTTGKDNVSSYLRFTSAKPSVKAVSLPEKWKALEAGGLRVDERIAGRRLILVDDKYQSGTTAQFVASKLLESGASEVYGLFCLKTLRDTDNM